MTHPTPEREPRPRGLTPRERPAPGAPVTPDGRYIVVRGRLWRRANPALPEAVRAGLVRALMDGRRAVGAAKRAERAGAADPEALARARAAVDAAKTALGERGPVWWDDGAPDLNRRMARTTAYAGWYAGLVASSSEVAPDSRDEDATT